MAFSWSDILRKKRKREKLSHWQKKVYYRDSDDNFVLHPSLFKLKESSVAKFFRIDEDFNLKKVQAPSGKKADNNLKKKKRIGSLEALKYLNIGSSITAPLILFLILGILLDKIYEIKPTFTLLSIILGSIGSFYNIYKVFKENDS